MTQATQVDMCKHIYTPGNCPNDDCRNSLRAKRLYVVEDEVDIAPSVLPESPIKWRVERLARLVAREYRLLTESVLSRCRTRNVAEARMALFFICRNASFPQWSYPEIAHATDRDPSTVMSGVKTIGSRITTDPHLAGRINRLLDVSRRAEQNEAPMAAVEGLPEIPDLEVG